MAFCHYGCLGSSNEMANQDAEVANLPYDYTQQQAEVVRLHDRYRRCLMDQKYYAYRLSKYQRWDTGTNLFAGVAMIFSLVTRNASAWLSDVSFAVGLVAALVFIGKPIFKVSEQIERYTTLHCGYADLFHRVEVLVADIRNAGHVSREHRQRIDEIFDRSGTLALREDTSVNMKRLEKFKAEVERAIPTETLWLPSK